MYLRKRDRERKKTENVFEKEIEREKKMENVFEKER